MNTLSFNAKQNSAVLMKEIEANGLIQTTMKLNANLVRAGLKPLTVHEVEAIARFNTQG